MECEGEPRMSLKRRARAPKMRSRTKVRRRMTRDMRAGDSITNTRRERWRGREEGTEESSRRCGGCNSSKQAPRAHYCRSRSGITESHIICFEPRDNLQVGCKILTFRASGG